MGLTRGELSEKAQRRLLEFFVLEVMTRTAADLRGLEAHTTTLFYRKLRVIIAEKLEHEASELAGEIALDARYLGGVRKGKHPLSHTPADSTPPSPSPLPATPSSAFFCSCVFFSTDLDKCWQLLTLKKSSQAHQALKWSPSRSDECLYETKR